MGRKSNEFNVHEKFKNSLMEMLANPDNGKTEVAAFIKNQFDFVPELHELFGSVEDEQMEEVLRSDAKDYSFKDDDLKEFKKLMQVVDTENGPMMRMINVEGTSKQLKESYALLPSKEEARFLMDQYYQLQAKRITVQNQLRSIKQNKDTSQTETVEVGDEKIKNKHRKDTGNVTFLEWLFNQYSTMEKTIQTGLDTFSDYGYLGKWAKQVVGIGPVFATCLMASLELKDDNTGNDTFMHAGNWWSYCGLNNNNRPWLGRDKSAKIVDEAIENNDGIIDDSVINEIAAKSQWKVEHIRKWCTDDNGVVEYERDQIIKAISLMPYNKDLKVLMYKIGDSFEKQKNKPKSLYGKLMKERAEYENKMNESGAYAEQAAECLKRSKSTCQKAFYKKGMLPPGHIRSRVRRYVEKLFISHVFEAAYYNKYGRMAPNPYVLMFKEGHVDYIGPEVEYNSVPRDAEYEKIHPTTAVFK